MSIYIYTNVYVMYINTYLYTCIYIYEKIHIYRPQNQCL